MGGDSHSHFQTLDTREAAQWWCRWLLDGGKRRLSWFLVCGEQTQILHSSFREARYSCTARPLDRTIAPLIGRFRKHCVRSYMFPDSQALRAFRYVSQGYLSNSCLCFSHHTHTGQWGICYCAQFDVFYERINLTWGTHMMPNLFNDT